jgi:hypothetical protein
MVATKVHVLVTELLGKTGYEEREHVQTVKITRTAHAKLRALADMSNQSKTALAADLLMAAIDDAVAALPNEPLDEGVADKLRGVSAPLLGVSHFERGDTVYHLEPRGIQDIVLERADNYLVHDQNEQDEKEDAQQASVVAASKNGAHK